jgi:hypothetical protein
MTTAAADPVLTSAPAARTPGTDTSGRITAIAEALEAARRRSPHPHFIGELELYCERDTCPARQVRLTVKELDGPTPPQLRCPACRHQLKIHHAQTIAEVNEKHRRSARVSVNVQLYAQRERRRNPHGLIAIPLGVLLDERLPESSAPRARS